MAPNSSKIAFVRGGCDPVFDVKTNGTSNEIVLRSVLAHLMKDEYEFPINHVPNYKEKLTIEEIIQVVDAFKSKYSYTLKRLCDDLDVNEESIGSVINGVSNELFCEGITWGRIVGLFVFVSELSLNCLIRGFSANVVEVIYEHFALYVKKHLQGWIDDHGSWEGIKVFSSRHCDNDNEASNISNRLFSLVWAKNIFYGTVRMLGIFANIANSWS